MSGPHKYTLIEKLGSGGYGTVYSAISNTGMIAVKKYKNSGDSISIEILREIAILFGIRHKHIILALFVSITDEIHLGLEHWGYSLRKYIRKNDIRTRLENVEILLIHTCKAICYLHNSGIFHRDIKPDNILVKTMDSNPVFKLCDFGLAKQGTGTAPYLGTGNVGTYSYRALELFSNNVCYNGSSDMWSLGCVLYEFVSGDIMFPGNNSTSVIQIILATIPVTQETLNALEINAVCEISDFEYPLLCTDEFMENNIDLLPVIDMSERLVSNLVCYENRLSAKQVLSIFGITYQKRLRPGFMTRKSLGIYSKIRDEEVNYMLRFDSGAHHLYIELFDVVLNRIYRDKHKKYLKNIQSISIACMTIASKFLDLSPLSAADFYSLIDPDTHHDWELTVLQLLKFNIIRRTVKNISLMKNYNIICDKTYNNIVSNEY